MKKTTKATLLSTLVFPGVGHIFLKKYLPALGFIAAFAFLLNNVVIALFERTEKISQKILNGEIPLEISAISQAITQQSVNSGQQDGFTIYALLFIWLFSAIDAYRLAKQEEVFQQSE